MADYINPKWRSSIGEYCLTLIKGSEKNHVTLINFLPGFLGLCLFYKILISQIFIVWIINLIVSASALHKVM